MQKKKLLTSLTAYLSLKTLSKLRIKGKFHSLLKDSFQKPTAKVILNCEAWNVCPLIRKKPREPAYNTVQPSPGSPVSAKGQQEEIKGKKVGWKERSEIIFVCRRRNSQ